MPIAVRGLTLGLDESEDLLPKKAAKRLRIKREDIRLWAPVRRSLDARRHDQLGFVYTVELALSGPPSREAQLVKRLRRADVALITPEQQQPLEPGSEPLPGRPFVVGFGPSGMFAALLLAQYGYRPLVIDRGPDVKTRNQDILVGFYREHRFNPESNLLFGEGGAGTYSDGKLYTRVNDPRVRLILETLYQHGADPDILIDSRPHIGSDKLPGICRRIRQHIAQLGGEVRFSSRLDDVVIRDGSLSAVVINGETIACGALVLGIGHSARDTLRMLGRRGVSFQAKPFQLGVRIEHPQSMVDRWQYGPHCGHHRLPPAEYHLVAKGAAGQRGDVFSFCMCPGGMILPTNESPDSISTNGASRSQRDAPLANAGLVLTVDPLSVHPPAALDPLATFDFLSQIERAAFDLTARSYEVPVQRACDFVQNRASDGKLETSYPLGGQWADLWKVLPPWTAEAIARGIEQLGRRLPGFGGPDALVAAPETRASGPVRMVRDPQTRESISTRNLYPVGEGAGYAGGIISAAVDGLKSAEAVVNRYAPPT